MKGPRGSWPRLNCRATPLFFLYEVLHRLESDGPELCEVHCQLRVLVAGSAHRVNERELGCQRDVGPGARRPCALAKLVYTMSPIAIRSTEVDTHNDGTQRISVHR